MALAEGQRPATPPRLPNPHDGCSPAIPRILADLSLLHRLIVRRVDAEHADWSAADSELLWAAFENALAELAEADIDWQNSAHVSPNHRRRGTPEQRELFLGEASRVLAESLDYQQTLTTIARLAVPEIADWCIIDLVGDDGALVRVACEHRDGNREQLLSALRESPPTADAISGAPNVVRTGVTEYIPVISDSLLQQREADPDRLSILRGLALNSTICAPLTRRDRTLGAITLSTAVGRELTLDDVRMVEDLARRAASAIENATLYTQAQRAVRAREEMLAIVTHDLRTPLSVVAAGASLLTSVDSVNPDGDRIRQRGETIQRAAQHMLRLVEDLTDLAQIDAGRFTVKRRVEDPGSVVRGVRDALEPVIARRGGTLEARVRPSLPTVHLDRARLAQVLGNLVGNASKVGASRISMGVELRDNDVVFWVADNGPGIPAEDLPRMFDRYWRGPGTEYTGSGLGLPIANGLVKAHGGRIWIESTVGTGSTFFFSIPRCPPRHARGDGAHEQRFQQPRL